MVARSHLKAHLDRLYAIYGRTYLTTDPVQLPRRYPRRDDREAAAFVAAALAYGRVAGILRSASAVLGLLGDRPARALRALDPRRTEEGLRGFAHRFNTGRDVAMLLAVLGRLLRDHGSLEGAFLAGYDPSHEDVGPALAAFCRRALKTDVSPLTRSGRIPPGAGVRFFFASPEDGSSCKRLNMFLRWMVREDQVDMGVWRRVPASALVVPLDTHVARISRYIGLTERRTADWRMAVEVTASLRELDPDDPVRYDFALSRLGILDACPSRRDPVKCAGCGIRSVCAMPAERCAVPA
jgi:uncharacterized protein (TIGR02757 family)